ncbi:MAG: carboxypeptidase-like regulatory domain-containing protein, partial [Haloferacaceae archaeon]
FSSNAAGGVAIAVQYGVELGHSVAISHKGRTSALQGTDLVVKDDANRATLQPLGDTKRKLDAEREKLKEQEIDGLVADIRENVNELRKRGLSDDEIRSRVHSSVPALRSPGSAGGGGAGVGLGEMDGPDRDSGSDKLFGVIPGTLLVVGLLLVGGGAASMFGLLGPDVQINLEEPSDDATISGDETLEVAGNVSGDDAGSVDEVVVNVTSDSAGSTAPERSVRLTGEDRTFRATFSSLDPGEYTVAVSTNETRVTREVTVEEADDAGENGGETATEEGGGETTTEEPTTDVDLQLQEPAGAVEYEFDEPLVVAGSVSGEDADAVEEVRIAIADDGSTIENATFPVADDGAFDESFGDLEPGEYTVTVSAGEESVTSDTVTLLERPDVQFSNFSVTEEAYPGDGATASVDVQYADETTIRLLIDGEPVGLEQRTTVSTSGGETQTVAFSFDAPEEPGSSTVAIERLPDDGENEVVANETLTVTERTLEITDPSNGSTVSKAFSVTVAAEGVDEVQVAVGDLTSKTVTVEDGTATAEFDVATGEYTLVAEATDPDVDLQDSIGITVEAE